MATIKLAEEFGQWASQFVDMKEFGKSESVMEAKHPTCPNCGDNVLREHLNKGDEVCRFCGPTRDLDTYGELEKERFDAWYSQYLDEKGAE